MDVSLAPGSSATVLTQAANKAYRGTRASQQTVLRAGEGALLEYLPHHLIPYSGSSYSQRTIFHLAPGAALITWDAYSAGRIARGERFAFDSLHGRTAIFRDAVPEAIDGFELIAGGEPFGGYAYMAAAYISKPEPLGALADELHASLGGMPGTLASASAPSPHLCVVRVLTHSARYLYRLLNLTRHTAREFLKLPAPAR
ncbi:MAG TPA: urease accessory protein UreD, partial [Rubrobacteraceae bacterium]|nr:urease accessory protein UreD [Rubrobacteraceae bacterium]